MNLKSMLKTVLVALLGLFPLTGLAQKNKTTNQYEMIFYCLEKRPYFLNADLKYIQGINSYPNSLFEDRNNNVTLDEYFSIPDSHYGFVIEITIAVDAKTKKNKTIYIPIDYRNVTRGTVKGENLTNGSKISLKSSRSYHLEGILTIPSDLVGSQYTTDVACFN